VNRPGDHLLASACLAEDEHRHVGLRNEFHTLHDVPQPGAGADHVFVDILPAKPREQRLPVGLRRFPERLEFVQAAVVFDRYGERFEDLAERAAMAGRERRARLCRHYEHASRPCRGAQRPSQHGPRHARRQGGPQPIVFIRRGQMQRLACLEPPQKLSPDIRGEDGGPRRRSKAGGNGSHRQRLDGAAPGVAAKHERTAQRHHGRNSGRDRLH